MWILRRCFWRNDGAIATETEILSFWRVLVILHLVLSHYFDELCVNGCTESFHDDNFRRSLWWIFHPNDISVSVTRGRLKTACTPYRPYIVVTCNLHHRGDHVGIASLSGDKDSILGYRDVFNKINKLQDVALDINIVTRERWLTNKEIGWSLSKGRRRSPTSEIETGRWTGGERCTGRLSQYWLVNQIKCQNCASIWLTGIRMILF